MKIHMSNIGMTLHVIHKLRDRGIDNVKVNMDWQHLIMNGEHLPEYAALLAAEGPPRATSMQTTAGARSTTTTWSARSRFMETLELALELRRANYGANGERLGFDLYPYTEDQVAAVKRSVLTGASSTGRGDASTRRRCARRSRARTRCARTRSCTRRSARYRSDRRDRRRHDRGQGDRDRRRRQGARARGGVVRAVDAAARLGRAGSRTTGCARPSARLSRVEATAVGFSGQMHGLVALDADDAPLRPAMLWNDQRTGAECAEIERRIGLDRLIELTGNRALTGFTAPKLLWLRDARAGGVRAHPLDPAAEGLRAAEALRRARDRRRRRVRDAALRRRATGAGARRCSTALEMPGEWLPPVYESPEIARRRRPGGRGARRRRHRARSGLGRARDVGVVFGAARALRGRPRGARARLLPRGSRHLARDGRDALGRGLAAVAARRDCARRVASTTLVAEAEAWPPGSEGLLFAPYLAGERTPHADPDARGAFVGLSLRHDRGALVRAVLEGVAYGLRDSLELLARARRAARTSAGSRAAGRAASSGARSSPPCSTCRSRRPPPRKARPTAPRYSPARERSVRRSRDAAARCVRVRGRTNPDPTWCCLRDGYTRFRRLYPALSTLRA